MSIILPPIALYNMERERLTTRHGHLKWFDQELRQIDRRLSLVRASENTHGQGMIPGFWHIKRDNSEFGVQDSFLPITGPDGQFMEPHSGVIEQLRGGDMQRDDVFDRVMREHDRAELAHQRKLQAGRDELRDEFGIRLKAYDSPSVLFSDDIPWKYRAKGRAEK